MINIQYNISRHYIIFMKNIAEVDISIKEIDINIKIIIGDDKNKLYNDIWC